MGSALESTDIKNKLEDLTGVKLKPGENPYNALIETCNDDHVECPPFPCKVFFFYVSIVRGVRVWSPERKVSGVV